MSVEVVHYSKSWPAHFDQIASALAKVLVGLPMLAIEHVGSTAVPDLVAKPVIDVDIIVERSAMQSAIGALVRVGYVHIGYLGLKDREVLESPDDFPRRHIYVCVVQSLHWRNHLEVRDVLRRDSALRDRYGAVKLTLSADPNMTIARYLAGKSDVLQEILDRSDLSETDKRLIRELNAN